MQKKMVSEASISYIVSENTTMNVFDSGLEII